MRDASLPGFYCMKCASKVARGDVVNYENMQGLSHVSLSGKLCRGDVVEIRAQTTATGKVTITYEAWESKESTTGLACSLLVSAEDQRGSNFLARITEDQAVLLVKIAQDILIASKGGGEEEHES